ncbi:MAG: hypothetical protein PF488_01205 [Patescibacteria group bacterium]|jgi:hypothetical protein|nr:hypothetical protein [Patescibacteria group bacterium]
MKKQIIILTILCFAYISSIGQTYLNPEVYDENGQYLKETEPPKSQANIFELGINFQGDKVYPRGSLEAYSSFDSGFGLWSYNRFNQAVIKPEWRDSGYSLKDYFNLGVSLALSYDFAGPKSSWIKTFAGIAYQSGQRYFGPIAGFYITKDKWEIKAFGVYALNTAYKDQYSEEELSEIPQYGSPVYIRGFDPNSWYRASLEYKLTKRFTLGLQSERFYGTNFSGRYDLKKSWRDMDKLYIKALSGWDFEFKHNTFFMGLVFVL